MRKSCQNTTGYEYVKKLANSTDSCETGFDLLRLEITDSKLKTRSKHLSPIKSGGTTSVVRVRESTGSHRRHPRSASANRGLREIYTQPHIVKPRVFPRSRYTACSGSLSPISKYSPCPPDGFFNKMSQRTRTTVDDSIVAKKSFPFRETPSGNLKIVPNQVVFESKKVSVLVADPNRTKVNVQGDLAQAGIKIPEQVMEGSEPQDYTSSEDFPDSPSDVLSPELRLERLGISNGDPFNWDNVVMHSKTNLYEELSRRITNYINADCIVYVENEEFNCHLIVLQSYSKFFESVKEKKVDLTEQTAVTTKAFATIYGWMITHQDDSYKLLNRDNCLELFSAAKYLQIKELEEQCWMFIDSEEVFNEETAFLLFMEAKNRGQVDVMQLMIPRIRKFFLTLVSSQDFLDLSAEEVCAFLSSSYIYINCEMEVLMSAVRWLRYDWKSRQKQLVDLMKCVRFGWIEPWQLIDVKRNPENPEFIAIMKNPEVLRMVDDGLAFVIIKYWYGHKNDDFQHWLDLLGLEEPAHRNLSGEDKNYVTYRQFLEYLDTYRNEAIREKSMPKSSSNKKSGSIRGRIKSDEIIKRPVPTMDEMLASRNVDLESSGSFLSSEFFETHPLPRKRESRRRVPKPRWRDNLEQYDSGNDQKNLQYIQSTKNIVSPVDQHQVNVMTMFEPRNELRRANSFVPPTKNFLAYGSLFAADQETVLVFGGIDPHSQYGIGRNTGKDVYRYVPEPNKWEFVTELPEPRHHHAVVFLKARVYLVGGADPREYDTRGKPIIVNTVWSFDPVSREWFSERSMKTPRKSLGLVVHRGKIFAIGGKDGYDRILSTVERYQPENGVWAEIAPLKSPRVGFASTVYREYIWVAGGMTGIIKNPLSMEVECYDTRTNEWTQLKTQLRFPRCFSRLFVMKDNLYLIGGAARTNDKDKTTSSVEAIDVWSNNEWRLITEMAIPRHGHAVAYIGTQILIIGGITTLYMKALSNVECYCVERCTWVRDVAGLPTTLSGHGAVTLPPASLL